MKCNAVLVGLAAGLTFGTIYFVVTWVKDFWEEWQWRRDFDRRLQDYQARLKQ